MPITEVSELWNGRTHKANDKAKRTYERHYLVKTDDSSIGPLAVRVAPGLPRIFDYYLTINEYDLGARCRDIQVDQHGESPILWDVIVSYETISGDEAKVPNFNQTAAASSGGGGQPPTQEPPTYTWDSIEKVVVEEKVKKEANDDAALIPRHLMINENNAFGFYC